MTVVTPLFRSRRSAAVYCAALEPAGIRVTYEPVRAILTSTTGLARKIQRYIGRYNEAATPAPGRTGDLARRIA